MKKLSPAQEIILRLMNEGHKAWLHMDLGPETHPISRYLTWDGRQHFAQPKHELNKLILSGLVVAEQDGGFIRPYGITPAGRAYLEGRDG